MLLQIVTFFVSLWDNQVRVDPTPVWLVFLKELEKFEYEMPKTWEKMFICEPSNTWDYQELGEGLEQIFSTCRGSVAPSIFLCQTSVSRTVEQIPVLRTQFMYIVKVALED